MAQALKPITPYDIHFLFKFLEQCEKDKTEWTLNEIKEAIAKAKQKEKE